MDNNSSSSEDGSQTRNSSPTPIGRTLTRLFVLLKERLTSAPRRNAWDELNREGHVKELTFGVSFSQVQMKNLLIQHFPALMAADFGRLRLYRSGARGSIMERVSSSLPDGKELKRLFSGSSSKRIYLVLKRGHSATDRSSSGRQALPSTTTVTPTSHTAYATAGSTYLSNVAASTSHAASNGSTNVSTLTTVPSNFDTTTVTSTVTAVVHSTSGPTLTIPETPASSLPVPVNGRSTRNYLTALAQTGGNITDDSSTLYIEDTEDTDLLQSVFEVEYDDVVEIPPQVPRQRSATVTTSTTTRPACTATTATNATASPVPSQRPPTASRDAQLTHKTATATSNKTGYHGKPFYGEGMRVGTIAEDMSPCGLGDAGLTESRTAEVARCEKRIPASFLHHSFEELCWQARNNERAMVVVIVDPSRQDGTRDITLRVLQRLNQECAAGWFLWAAESSSRDGQKVLKLYGNGDGDQVIFLTPSPGQSPVLLDRIFIGRDWADDTKVEMLITGVLARARVRIQSLTRERERLENERSLKKEQENRLKESSRADALKQSRGKDDKDNQEDDSTDSEVSFGPREKNEEDLDETVKDIPEGNIPEKGKKKAKKNKKKKKKNKRKRPRGLQQGEEENQGRNGGKKEGSTDDKKGEGNEKTNGGEDLDQCDDDNDEGGDGEGDENKDEDGDGEKPAKRARDENN